MGVSGLWPLLEPVAVPVTLESLQGKRLAVDISLWLHQSIRGAAAHQNATQNPHLLTLFQRIVKLLFYGVRPIFVFDGEQIPAFKQRVLIWCALFENQVNLISFENERRQRRELASSQLQQAHDRAVQKVMLQAISKDGLIDEQAKLELERLSAALQATAATGRSKEQLFEPFDPDLDENKAKLNSNEWQKDADWLSDDDDGEDGEGELDWQLEDVHVNAINEFNVKTSSPLKTAVLDTSGSNLDDSYHELEDDEAFDALPVALRRDLLRERHDQMKQTRLRKHQMPVQSDAFSEFQIKRLKCRNSVITKLTQVGREYNQLVAQSALGDSELQGRNVRTLVSEGRKRHHLLIDDDRVQADCSVLDGREDETYVSQKVLNKKSNSEVKKSLQDYINALKSESKLGREGTDQEKEKEDSLNNGSMGEHITDTEAIEATSSGRSEKQDQDRPTSTLTALRASPIDFEVEPIDQINQSIIESDILINQSKSILNDGDYDQPSTSTKPDSIYSPKINIEDNLNSQSLDSMKFPTTVIENEPNSNQQELDSDWSDEDFEEVQSVPTAKELRFYEKPIDGTVKSDLNSSTLIYANKTTTVVTLDLKLDETEKWTAESMETPESFAADGFHIDPHLPSTSKSSDKRGDTNQSINNDTATARTVTSDMYEQCQNLIRLFGLPYLVAPGEAEAECAQLEAQGLVSGTVGDDSDLWLFGAQTVFRHVFNRDKHVQRYDMTQIQRNIGLSRPHLILLAMLSGCDYTQGVRGVGGVTALEILAQFTEKSINRLDSDRYIDDALIDPVQPLRDFKRWHGSILNNPNQPPINAVRARFQKSIKCWHLPESFPDAGVYAAFQNPLIDESNEKFVFSRPDFENLTDFARNYLNWTDSQTKQNLRPLTEKYEKQKHLEATTSNKSKKSNKDEGRNDLGGKSMQTQISSFMQRPLVQDANEQKLTCSKRVKEALQLLKAKTTAPGGGVRELDSTASTSTSNAKQKKTKQAANKKKATPKSNVKRPVEIKQKEKPKRTKQQIAKYAELSEESESED